MKCLYSLNIFSSLHEFFKLSVIFGIFLSTSEMNLTNSASDAKNCRSTHHTWHAYVCCVRVCVCVPKHATTKGILRILPGSKYVCHLQRNVKWKCLFESSVEKAKTSEINICQITQQKLILFCASLGLSLFLSLPNSLSLLHPSLSVCISVSIHMCAEIRAIIRIVFVTLT